MRDFGFLESEEESIAPLLNKKLHFISIDSAASPYEAVKIMRKYQISQMPVIKDKKVVGILSELILIENLYGKEKIPVSVEDIMNRTFIELSETISLSELAHALSEQEMVIIVDKKGKPIDVLTRIDFLSNVG